MSTKNAYAYGTHTKDALRVGLETDQHSDGPKGKNAHAPVGLEKGSYSGDPDGTNGFHDSRAHAHVGPSDSPNGSETVSHGVNGKPAHTPVGLRLDGNTDTRGLVSEAERVHLQSFGTDVRAMRKATGLTQERLGKLAGIGTIHISRLEQGRRRPSVDAIKALARILAPAGTADAVEQRWGALAGDSLREGTARRKRRVDNKQRRAAAAELTKLQTKMGRIVADKERQGLPVSDSLRNLASLDLSARIRPVDDELGITGIEPARSPRDAREEVRDLIRSVTRRRR